MEPLPIDDVAEKLAEIHERPFGGKQRGRFSMTRERFKELSGRERLEPSVIANVNKALFEQHNLALVQCGMSAIGVIDANKVMAWRTVPKKKGT